MDSLWCVHATARHLAVLIALLTLLVAAIPARAQQPYIFTTIDDPAGINGTSISGINDSGQIVGSFRDSNFYSHGFADTNGSFEQIDDPQATNNTYAMGINDAGVVAGYYYGAGFDSHGFVDTNGSFNTIDDPAAVYGTYVTGINDSGQVAGYYVDGTLIEHGFVDTNGTFQTIDDPSAGAAIEVRYEESVWLLSSII